MLLYMWGNSLSEFFPTLKCILREHFVFVMENVKYNLHNVKNNGYNVCLIFL